MKYKFSEGRLFIKNKEIKLSKYTFIEQLGRGANAVVLKGVDSITLREVAIKVWLPRKNFIYPDKIRFLEEIRKVSKLNSPRIVQIYSADYFDDNYFYAVFEYVDGKTLKEWLKEERNVQERCKVLIEICREMELVHEKSIYHGDLHTKNIMIKNDKSIKLLDFNTSIFAKRKDVEEAHKREGKLILETALKLLIEETAYNFLDKSILNYPSECVPKALIKLANLILQFDKIKCGTDSNGRKFFIYDFAKHITEVPFFNLNSIIKYFINLGAKGYYLDLLLGNIYANCNEKLGKVALNRNMLSDELMEYSEKNKSRLIDLYNMWRINFVDIIKEKNLEKTT